MIGIYFSGTGNSKYALENFLREYNNHSVMFSVEDENLIGQIGYHDEIIFSYPVQYSAVPKYLSDFVHSNAEIWKGKGSMHGMLQMCEYVPQTGNYTAWKNCY